MLEMLGHNSLAAYGSSFKKPKMASGSVISYDFTTSANGLALGGLAMLGLALGAGFAREEN